MTETANTCKITNFAEELFEKMGRRYSQKVRRKKPVPGGFAKHNRRENIKLLISVFVEPLNMTKTAETSKSRFVLNKC